MEARSDGKGTLLVEPGCARALALRGLDSYSALMRFRGDGPAREKPARRIARLVLPGAPVAAGARPGAFFLKQHIRGSLREALGDLLGGRMPRSAARREWEAIGAPRAAGVRTMSPVALGEARRLPWLGGSFILTAEVGGVRLEDWIRAFRGNFREKRCILSSLAGCARAMHGAGLTHRDFYLCHLFLLPASAGGGPALIDLQRVRRGRARLARRAVKDIAALNYSAPSPAVTRADRMRFLLAYLGLRTLDAAGRRFAVRVAGKTERIRRHDMKKQARAAAAAPGEGE